jgi:hypothetical protein
MLFEGWGFLEFKKKKSLEIDYLKKKIYAGMMFEASNEDSSDPSFD